MNKQLKDKWIKALRSGEYEQGMGSLMAIRGSHKEFCCLGVLCDIVNPKGWDEANTHLLESDGESFLSAEGLEIVGLGDKTQRHLANTNDEGIPFEEIADIIEAEV